jgi:hypothetical protein
VTSEPVSKQLVTATAADVCPGVCPSEPKTDVETAGNGRSESGFAAAVLMIERLPLSDAEKAEAVQRLLQSKRHQDSRNRSN